MGGSVACRDLREFLKRLEEQGELQRVTVSVDPVLEIAAITDRVCKLPNGGPALYFEQVADAAWPVVTNIFGSERRMALALGQANLADLTGWLADLLASLLG